MKNIKRLINVFIIINAMMILLLALVFFNNHLNQKNTINSLNHKDYQNNNDITRPDIILAGSDIEINLYESYQEPGYQAIDNIDGDITSKVEISSDLNNKLPGTYTIIYRVEDSSGNQAEVSRQIKVKEIINEVTYSSTETDNEQVKNLIDELTNYLKNYQVSVGYINLENNFTYLYNAKKEYFGASLIKTLDAMYVYENNLLDQTMLKNVKLAITKSDNNAHHYIVNNIGFNNLKQYAKYLGGPLNNCNTLDFCNTTVKSQLAYLTHLYQLINNLDNGQELASYFYNTNGNYLNLEDTKFYHKYGQSDEYYHDVGISDSESPYIIVILTSERKNPAIKHTELINNISSQINNINSLLSIS